MGKSINLRQQRFLNFYIESGIATDALKKAGYKAVHADKAAFILLQKPYIQAELEKIRGKMNNSIQLTYEHKLKVLEKGIKYYEESEDYDKAARLIEVANKMQGHISPTQIESLSVGSSVDDIRNAMAAYYKKDM